MEFPQFRIAAVLAGLLCASGLGCSSLKTFKPKTEDARTSTASDLLGEDVSDDGVNPAEKRISLLHAKASLAEMDSLPAEAISSYEKVLEIDPSNVTALHRLALLHIQQCDYKDAEARFQAALRGATDNAPLHNDYGYFCHLQNRPAEAIEHLSKAVEINPDYFAAHNNLGLVLAEEGQQEEAERHFRLGKCDQAETLNNLALARFMKSDIGDAKSLYKQALKIDPNQERARSSLASVNRIDTSAESSHAASISPTSFHAVDESPLK